jgi:hypothetical protein
VAASLPIAASLANEEALMRGMRPPVPWYVSYAAGAATVAVLVAVWEYAGPGASSSDEVALSAPEVQVPPAAPTAKAPAVDVKRTASSTSKPSSQESPTTSSKSSDNEKSNLAAAIAGAMKPDDKSGDKAPAKGKVLVTAHPSSALIYDAAGECLGKGSAQVPVPKGTKTTVVVLLDGHSPGRVVLDGKSSTADITLKPISDDGPSSASAASTGKAKTPAKKSTKTKTKTKKKTKKKKAPEPFNPFRDVDPL